MFQVVNINAEWAIDDEPMGSKDKFWVGLPNDSLPWLFKYSRVNGGVETGEHWSEKLAAEIASLLCIPHAQVKLARFGESWGSLSRKFDALEEESVELVHGNEVLAGAIPDYDPYRRYGQNLHTLENILRAVQCGIQDNGERLVEAYRSIGGYVVLDALILNTDRHHENWALLRRTRADAPVTHWLAPSFDHASSLGRELQRDLPVAWKSDPLDRISWYAKRGKGGVFLHPRGKKGANPLQLAELARRRWPDYIEPWLEHLGQVGLEPIVALLGAVQEECLSQEHRWFVRGLPGYSYSQFMR